VLWLFLARVPAGSVDFRLLALVQNRCYRLWCSVITPAPAELRLGRSRRRVPTYESRTGLAKARLRPRGRPSCVRYRSSSLRIGTHMVATKSLRVGPARVRHHVPESRSCGSRTSACPLQGETRSFTLVPRPGSRYYYNLTANRPLGLARRAASSVSGTHHMDPGGRQRSALSERLLPNVRQNRRAGTGDSRGMEPLPQRISCEAVVYCRACDQEWARPRSPVSQPSAGHRRPRAELVGDLAHGATWISATAGRSSRRMVPYGGQ